MARAIARAPLPWIPHRPQVYSTMEERCYLGDTVAGVGYVDQKANNICAILPADNPELRRHNIKWNENKAQRSPSNPLVQSGLVGYSSVAGSTMNAFSAAPGRGAAGRASSWTLAASSP